MGKGDRVENYYAKQGDEWVPLYLGGSKGGPQSGQKSSQSSGSSAEEYYIQRDGKWVKISGVESASDLISRLKLSASSQGNPSMPAAAVQAPVGHYPTQIVAPTPQGPLQYHEFFITVNPPTDPVQDSEEPDPVPANPRRIPRQPIRALPNDYAEGPITAQRAPVYRQPPRPVSPRRRPPSPRFDSPRRRRSRSPPSLPIPDHTDSYAQGREAYYRSTAGAIDYVDDSCDCGGECSGGPRTSAAPGYYLAGYIYHGDPAQPPKLEPIGAAGTVQVPPGHYLAGYTS